ncbi:MAG: fumarylacetoacetate hydrolase family protein, partial [Pseudomonadota bacterium]
PFAFAPGDSEVPYPPGTQDLHYEMEFVVAIGQSVFRASQEEAAAAVFGYGCGLDMTRRDLQQKAKDTRRSWDVGKDFENSAVLTDLATADSVGEIGNQRIHLSVNGMIRQDAVLSDMIWSVEEIICHLSTLYHLGSGDLIMTGTPAGVGPVGPGDTLTGGIDGLPDLSLSITDAE